MSSETLNFQLCLGRYKVPICLARRPNICHFINYVPHAHHFAKHASLSLPNTQQWFGAAGVPYPVSSPGVPSSSDGPIISQRGSSLALLLAIPVIVSFLSCDLGNLDPSTHAQTLSKSEVSNKGGILLIPMGQQMKFHKWARHVWRSISVTECIIVSGINGGVLGTFWRMDSWSGRLYLPGV